MTGEVFYQPVVESTSRLLYYVKDAPRLRRRYPDRFTEEYLEAVYEELEQRRVSVERRPSA